MKPGDPQDRHDAAVPEPSEAERRALEALRRDPPPRAPDAFRARVREAFVSDRASQTGAAGSTSRSRPAPGPRRGRRRVALPLALAAALVLAWVGYGGRPAAPWRLVEVQDPDGDLTGRADRTPGATLPPGFLETPEHGAFELALGAALRLRMSPCSGLYLPEPPRRWLPGAITVEVQRGEVFGSTGDRPPSSPLVLITPQAVTRILGTTFAVFLTEDGTCVCLLEGRVVVEPRAGGEKAAAPVTLTAGTKYYLYGDGRAPRTEPLDAGERMKLEQIRAAARNASP